MQDKEIEDLKKCVENFNEMTKLFREIDNILDIYDSNSVSLLEGVERRIRQEVEKRVHRDIALRVAEELPKTLRIFYGA